MSSTPTLHDSLAALHLHDATRLYRLRGEGELGELLVQAWSLREELSAPWTLELVALGARADLDLHALLGRAIVLNTVLAEGRLQPRSGLVMAAAAEQADGGFARYRLTVRPWPALLAHTRRSRVWQDQTLIQIVDSVFAGYPAHAHWRWSADVAAHLARSPFLGTGQARSYTVQYRETDLAFLARLLAEEGLGWRLEEAHEQAPEQASEPAPEPGQEPSPSAPGGPRVVFFADSPGERSCPPDASSRRGGGIRWHRAGGPECSDTVQALGAARVLPAALTTVLSWDYRAKRSVAASVPTAHPVGGPHAARLEAFEPAGAYAFATPAQAQRAGALRQEALEARSKTWLGRSTVRSFTAGRCFELTGSPLDAQSAGRHDGAHRHGGTAPQAKRFLLTAVIHAGINNLPQSGGAGLSADPTAELLAAWVPAEVRRQARATGYGNHFQALCAHRPWRPVLGDGAGRRLHAKPTVCGPLLATVVGADGASQGPEAIHTDRLGRIRIRHDFQPAGQASTWVRVLQRYAGAGMGCQFTPRIGQQVLVGFLDNDIDRPLVIGALYDGRGEAGVAPTPGGRSAAADLQPLARSEDHRPGAQGNLTGGHAPPWHGAGAPGHAQGGQRNAAALSGWKSREFGGSGHNQLVFDDSDRQLRARLATTQHATQLELGHLIHQADNHRGSFRGLGFELRTDAYGTVRAKQGLLLSSYATRAQEPAGDNAAGIALAAQLAALGKTLSEAARTHQTVQLAGHIGSTRGHASALSDGQAPLGGLHTTLKGMVSEAGAEQAFEDAAARNTRSADAGAPAGQGKLPHTADPVVAITAKAGLAVAAGRDIQLGAGETIALGAGQDSEWAVGAGARIHSGQAIGMLGGALGAGRQAAGRGLSLIAGHGDIALQAQGDRLQIAARNDLTIQSATRHIDWAAARRIVLGTAGGASITIEAGSITVSCPGKITVRAQQKAFEGPEKLAYPLPTLPQQVCLPCLLKARKAGARVAIA